MRRPLIIVSLILCCGTAAAAEPTWYERALTQGKPTVSTLQQDLFVLGLARGRLATFVDGIAAGGCQYTWQLRVENRGREVLHKAGELFFCPKQASSRASHRAAKGDKRHAALRGQQLGKLRRELARGLRGFAERQRTPRLYLLPLELAKETYTVELVTRVSRASSYSHERVIVLVSDRRGRKLVRRSPLRAMGGLREVKAPRPLGLLVGSSREAYLVLAGPRLQLIWIDLRRGFRK